MMSVATASLEADCCTCDNEWLVYTLTRMHDRETWRADGSMMLIASIDRSTYTTKRVPCHV